MSGGDIAQILVGTALLITSLGNFLLSWHNATKIEQVHQATNGLTTKLVDITASASKAEGKLEGRAEILDQQKT